VAVEVLVQGPLIVKGAIKKDSLRVVKGLGEPEMGKLRVGEVVQLVRFGFYRVDINKSGGEITRISDS